MKTRILALCLALALCLSLAACKEEPAPKVETTLADTTPSVTQDAENVPAPPVQETTVPVDTKPVVPQDRIEGTYEQWLAAASVQVTTLLMYPDCEVMAIYALSETPLESKMESKGVVLHIKDGDMNIWIKSAPLEMERTESGTRDLKAAGINYNTYDEVDPFSISAVTQLSLESLQPYIEQTMLPSIYER